MPSVQENSKSKNMDEPIAIIEDLLQAIAKKKQIRDGIKQLNPEWEQLSDENWKRQEACCWIHGATDTYESIELEKWLYHYPPLSITQNSKAVNHYKEWEEFISEEGMYTDFSAGDLPQIHPISQEIVADILKELAHQVVYGRKNASHHAIEALALSWLCLTSSRIRLPKKLEQIHEIQTSTIISTNEYPELLIPTLFGNLPVRISIRLAKFLQSVAMISSDTPRATILSTSLPDLRKSFNTAIKRAALPSNLREITFLTFLSPPHHFGEHIR